MTKQAATKLLEENHATLRAALSKQGLTAESFTLSVGRYEAERNFDLGWAVIAVHQKLGLYVSGTSVSTSASHVLRNDHETWGRQGSSHQTVIDNEIRWVWETD